MIEKIFPKYDFSFWANSLFLLACFSGVPKVTHPFGISRSTHSHYDIVYIYLESEGIIGRGEAAPSGRYNEFTKDILKILNNGIDLPEKLENPKEFIKIITPLCLGIKALEVAFSMAALDWWCQKKKIPLCEYFEADPNKTPKTSFTI